MYRKLRHLRAKRSHVRVSEFREYLVTTLYLPEGRMRRFYRYVGP